MGVVTIPFVDMVVGLLAAIATEFPEINAPVTGVKIP